MAGGLWHHAESPASLSYLHYLQNLVVLLLTAFCFGGPSTARAAQIREFIQISKDGGHFALSQSKAPFIPWGFNYDRDDSGRLLENYWNAEWNVVEKHFAQMKALGANTVRIHLQTGKFMSSPRRPNRAALKQLRRLLQLAERTGLYLDITGLGCYERNAVPHWYNALGERERWAVQARFWEAVAQCCRKSPAVFCYDLMNEPLANGDEKTRDWTPGDLGGKCYVQRLVLDSAGRTQPQVAAAWVGEMVGAIRQHDRRHLITVGAIPWALTFPGAKPVFYSKEAGARMDFVSLHIYPKHGEIDKALATLPVYNIGKPMVIEEMFPLSCGIEDLNQFIDGSRGIATGWFGFYWGKSAEQYRQETNSVANSITASWLDYFARKTPEMVGQPLKW